MIFGWGKKKKKAADKPAQPVAQATAPAPQVPPAAPAPAAQAPTASPRAPAPWGPESDAAANQAIGGLRNYLLGALKTDRGIHAETILVASGALAGYAAQRFRREPSLVRLLGKQWVVAHIVGVIGQSVGLVLATAGAASVDVRTELSPAWSTDWISAAGTAKLAAAGIAPPEPVRQSGQVLLQIAVRCPHCGSPATQELSRFGSTACKSLWRCTECREPFDHIKAH